MTKTSTELISQDIAYIKASILEIKDFIKNEAVTQKEFLPVKNIVNGAVGFLAFSVLGALVALVVTNK